MGDFTSLQDTRDEGEIFDSLPRELRDIMNYGIQPIHPREILRLHKKHPLAKTIEICNRVLGKIEEKYQNKLN